MISSLSTADVDLMFLDWSREAAISEVSRRYAPSTGLEEEARFASPIRVVVAARDVDAERSPAAHVPVGTTTFLIRAADLPGEFALAHANVTLEGRRYEVRTIHPATPAGVIALECVQAADC